MAFDTLKNEMMHTSPSLLESSFSFRDQLYGPVLLLFQYLLLFTLSHLIGLKVPRPHLKPILIHHLSQSLHYRFLSLPRLDYQRMDIRSHRLLV